MATKAWKHPLNLQRMWYKIDAKGWRVGHLASEVAKILIGKHKPTFHPSRDVGDHVIITNCDQVEFSGEKWKRKVYRWHSGYPGGLKEVPAERWRENYPERVLEHAVRGMLPKNPTRHERMKRLRLTPANASPEALHAHDAQLACTPSRIAREPSHLMPASMRDVGSDEDAFAYRLDLDESQEHVFVKVSELPNPKLRARREQKQASRQRQRAYRKWLVGKGDRPQNLRQHVDDVEERLRKSND